VGVALLAGCSTGASGSAQPAVARSQWVDQPVSFEAGGLTVYGTYRHPADPARAVPAALLIAGSGPTDRNGNTPLLPGPVNTLRTVADRLSADGVASLRYDKLGSGRTGLGAARPGTIGIRPFEQEAAAALRFLARQPGTDRGRLAVIGHSEGALFALLLATGAAGPVPPIHALGLLEPLSRRYLDIITAQIAAQTSAAQRAGQITAQQAGQAERTLATAVRRLRATGTAPPDLPPELSTVLGPVTALFLSEADRYDPALLAARLTIHTPVLVTCSDADVQVTCSEVSHLVAGLTRASAGTDFVHLTGVDHVLKQDPSGAETSYAQPLPFSPQLRDALRTFTEQHL
jgi:alpha-beta hydrolase superfamily lysophospholipase